MAKKRFTDCEKWDNTWFMGLSPTAKHLWNYLLDHCDNAGVIEPNTKLASFQIGQSVEPNHFAELGDRIQTLANGKLWISKFIKFQYGELSSGSLVHQSVIKLITSHGLDYPIPCLSHNQAMNMGCASHKRKNKDKRKEKEGEVQGGIREVFDAWNAQTVFPQVLVLSDKRRRELQARLKDSFFAGNWKAALAKMPSSPFLTGNNDRHWKARFDWFLRPDSVANIMEGKYNGYEAKTAFSENDWQKHKAW